MYPCALIVWDIFWRHRAWYRCFKLKKGADETEVDQDVPHKEHELRPVEKFFSKPWTNFTNKIRFPLVIIAAVLMGASIWLATRLETPVESEQFLPEDDPLVKATRLLTDGFPSFDGNQNIGVCALWGISGVDRSGAEKYDPEDFGTAVYADEFSMKSAAAQERILEDCSYFSDPSLDLLTTSPSIPEKVKCRPAEYLEWKKSTGSAGFETFDTDAALISDLIKFGNSTVDGQQPFLRFLTGKEVVFNEDRSRIVYAEASFVAKVPAASPAKIVDHITKSGSAHWKSSTPGLHLKV